MLYVEKAYLGHAAAALHTNATVVIGVYRCAGQYIDEKLVGLISRTGYRPVWITRAAFVGQKGCHRRLEDCHAGFGNRHELDGCAVERRVCSGSSFASSVQGLYVLHERFAFVVAGRPQTEIADE